MKRSNQGEILGFKFRLQNISVFITETDLNTALRLSTDNFIENTVKRGTSWILHMDGVHTGREQHGSPGDVPKSSPKGMASLLHHYQPCLHSKNLANSTASP